MTNRYDLCTGRKDKDGKTRWTKIGSMFPSKQGEGFAIKLDALPLPSETGEVWISAFVPKDRDDAPRQQSAMRTQAHSSRSNDINDDIPF